jgi:hypothetical protein
MEGRRSISADRGAVSVTTTQRELRQVAAGAFVGAALAHCAVLDSEPREWAAELTPHEAVDALSDSPDRDIRKVGLALRRLLVFPAGVTRAGTIGALEASLAWLRSGPASA